METSNQIWIVVRDDWDDRQPPWVNLSPTDQQRFNRRIEGYAIEGACTIFGLSVEYTELMVIYTVHRCNGRDGENVYLAHVTRDYDEAAKLLESFNPSVWGKRRVICFADTNGAEIVSVPYTGYICKWAV